MTADVVKILWRDDPSKLIQTYTLNTVTYGTAAAPFLAIRSLHYASEQFPFSHKIGKAVITNDFYVDDMLTGADDFHTLQVIKAEVSEILSKSKCTLSKWHSNNPQISTKPDGIKEMRVDDGITSTLGISWHPKDDTFMLFFLRII